MDYLVLTILLAWVVVAQVRLRNARLRAKQRDVEKALEASTPAKAAEGVSTASIIIAYRELNKNTYKHPYSPEDVLELAKKVQSTHFPEDKLTKMGSILA